MENSWPPKDAPPVNKDFTKEQGREAEKEGIKPVTKAELEKLEAQRKVPKPEKKLKPKHLKASPMEELQREVGKPPKSPEDLKREERIAHMRERLNRERGRCQNDFTRKM